MTRDKLKQLLSDPVLVALANGEQVQTKLEDKWYTLGDTFDFDNYCRFPHLYRIKPKPLKVWAIVDSDREGWRLYFDTKSDAIARFERSYLGCARYRLIKLCEVEEGQ